MEKSYKMTVEDYQKFNVFTHQPRRTQSTTLEFSTLKVLMNGKSLMNEWKILIF